MTLEQASAAGVDLPTLYAKDQRATLWAAYFQHAEEEEPEEEPAEEQYQSVPASGAECPDELSVCEDETASEDEPNMGREDEESCQAD